MGYWNRIRYCICPVGLGLDGWARVRCYIGLEGLSWGEGRTRDPDKLNRIGLGDPRTGGTGALVEIVDEKGDVTAALITGRKDSHLYGRLPGQDQAFQVKGDLPPFYNHDAWLDFDILEISSDAISAVRIFDAMGESLYLQRAVCLMAQPPQKP